MTPKFLSTSVWAKAAAFSLICVFAAELAHSSDGVLAPTYCLSQRVLVNGTILFFDWGKYDELVLTERSRLSEIGTNAPVIVNGGVRASVNSWVDSRGFQHTTAFLRRQVRFDRWLQEMNSGQPSITLPAMNSNGPPIAISGIEPTGILDRQTLWSTDRKMQYRLLAIRRGVEKKCRNATHGKYSCKKAPWPDREFAAIAGEIDVAEQELVNYESELDSIPFSGPTAYKGA